jgi:hypothetical protein
MSVTHAANIQAGVMPVFKHTVMPMRCAASIQAGLMAVFKHTVRPVRRAWVMSVYGTGIAAFEHTVSRHSITAQVVAVFKHTVMPVRCTWILKTFNLYLGWNVIEDTFPTGSLVTNGAVSSWNVNLVGISWV